MNFFKSLFGSSDKETPEEKQEREAKEAASRFESLKYGGIEALNAHNPALAVQALTEATAMRYDHEALFYLASSYIKMEEYLKAYEVFKTIAEAEPDEAKSFKNLAHVAFALKDFMAMCDNCQKAMLIDDKDAETYFLFAQANHGLGDDITAIATLTKTLSIAPDMYGALLLRSQILISMNQPAEALDDANAMLSMHPDSEDAMVIKGKALAMMERTDEALAEFDNAIRYNGMNREAYLSKTGALLAVSRTDEALAVLNEAIECMDDFDEAYKMRGAIFLDRGDKDAAAKDAQKVIELTSGNDITGNYSL